MLDINNWRISSSLEGLDLGTFIYFNIPVPDTSLYKPFQEEQSYWLGRKGIAGFESFLFGWSSLTTHSLQILQTLVDSVRVGSSATHIIYMTIPLAYGRLVGNDWRNVSAVVHPIAVNGRTSPSANGVLANNVEITLMNVEIISEYI